MHNKEAFTLGARVRCPSRATRWVLMWTRPIFKYTRLNSGIVLTLYSGTKVSTGLCVHLIFVSSGVAHCFLLPAKLMSQTSVWKGEME